MVTLVAHWEAEADQGDLVAGLLLALSARTRAEPGCITYEPHRDRDNPQRFVLYEQYEDEDALEAHRDSPHFRDIVLERIASVLVERRVQLLTPLAGSSLTLGLS